MQNARRYSIMNAKTRYTLCTSDNPDYIQHMWNHIPRRKSSELLWVDNVDGTVLKTKPKKGGGEHHYYDEENYKKGVQLFKDGAVAVLMDSDETGEVWIVRNVEAFKGVYKIHSEHGDAINNVERREHF